MRFLKYLFKRPAGAELELISVHVPKTAGSSFLLILKTIYQNALQTIYSHNEGVTDIWNGGLPPTILPKSRVIHGHFPATPALLDAFPHARLVAWVRDPVARIVSYYHFWRRVERHGNPNHDYFLDNDCSLLEFARLDFMKNEMLDYFKRVPMKRFSFIGTVETFDRDIHRLATKLGWRLPEIPVANATSRKTPITGVQRRELEAILADEIAFYRRVRKMRQKRRGRDVQQPAS